MKCPACGAKLTTKNYDADVVKFTDEDRAVLREVAEWLETLSDQDCVPSSTRALYLAGRLAGLAGRVPA